MYKGIACQNAVSISSVSTFASNFDHDHKQDTQSLEGVALT